MSVRKKLKKSSEQFKNTGLKTSHYRTQVGHLKVAATKLRQKRVRRAAPDLDQDFKVAARVEPRSAGVSTVLMPAAFMAADLSFSVPLPPEMMAPAGPLRRPGGAGWPGVKPTTGFFFFV